METLNNLTLQSVAVPHDRTRRVVLADAADENNDHAVGAALRDDTRGPLVLKATWQLAQDRGIEPEYRLLWSVVTMQLEVKRAVEPAPEPVVDPPVEQPAGQVRRRVRPTIRPLTPGEMPPVRPPADDNPDAWRLIRERRWVGRNQPFWSEELTSSVAELRSASAEMVSDFNRMLGRKAKS